MRVDACGLVRPVAEGNHIDTTGPFLRGTLPEGLCAPAIALQPESGRKEQSNRLLISSSLAAPVRLWFDI
jgi:hypothetical protein